MVNREKYKLELTRRKRAQSDFLLFTKYTKRNFSINWHHRVLAGKLQAFAEGKIKKLMIFLPPQVGKSEMSTRRLPAYILGRDPDKRIAVCAYNQTFASQFNRDIQRIVADPSYKYVFPGTTLNEKNVVSNAHGSYVRNSEIFEIVGKKGFLKTVGIGGPLTGTSVDIGIIDDPIKDAAEAYSSTFREKTWDWYNSVFLTRLHNDSQQLITLTRWHEDDLAGRILKDDKDSQEWEVIILPAVREDYLTAIDPRELGQALWPERHSLERMLDVKKKNPLIFSSLYQQRPYFNAEEGRFAWAFDRAKHVGRCPWDPRENTILSFDFNRNPICCTVFQHIERRRTIHVVRCIKLKESNIKALLAEIRKFYPLAVFIVTGDATGKASNAMVEDNMNYYRIIQKTLNLNKAAMRQPTVNPPVEGNRVLLNALLQNYNWVIDEENAAGVIFDFEYVKVLPDGSIDKTDRKDPTKQADALDTVRYFCNTFFKDYLKAANTAAEQPMPSPATSPAVTPTQQPTVPQAPPSPSMQALVTIERGGQVVCKREDYLATVRNAILTQAGKWIDGKDGVRAQIALMEVKRLDTLFSS